MSHDVKSNEETGNTINPTAEKNENVTNDTAVILTSQETDTTSNTPSKSDVIEIDNKSEEIVINDASKNETCVEEVKATVNQPAADESAEEVTAENKNIPADVKIDTVTVNGNVDEIHQNGSDNVSHQDVEETKAQIEVKSNTDKASADSLEIISSSEYNNPPNVQDHDKHVNDLGDNFEDVGMAKDVENDVSNSINELGIRTDTENDENDLNVENAESDVVKPTTDEKLVHEPSPPPLPISPPPSHVSVFAFTNKEESADDSSEKTESISDQLEDKKDQKPDTIAPNPSEHTNVDEVYSTSTVNCSPAIDEQCEEKLLIQNKDHTVLAPLSSTETDVKSTVPNFDKDEAMDNNIEVQNIEEEIFDIEESKQTIDNNSINDIKEIGDDNNSQKHLSSVHEVEIKECENNQVSEDNSLNVAKDGDEIELVNHKNDDLNKNCDEMELNTVQNQLQETLPYTNEDNDTNIECENENNAQSHKLDQSEADDEITQLNTHHEAHMHDKTVFDKIDNLVREETKVNTLTR